MLAPPRTVIDIGFCWWWWWWFACCCCLFVCLLLWGCGGSLHNGFILGEYFQDGIQFYAWCSFELEVYKPPLCCLFNEEATCLASHQAPLVLVWDFKTLLAFANAGTPWKRKKKKKKKRGGGGKEKKKKTIFHRCKKTRQSPPRGWSTIHWPDLIALRINTSATPTDKTDFSDKYVSSTYSRCQRSCARLWTATTIGTARPKNISDLWMGVFFPHRNRRVLCGFIRLWSVTNCLNFKDKLQ